MNCGAFRWPTPLHFDIECPPDLWPYYQPAFATWQKVIAFTFARVVSGGNVVITWDDGVVANSYADAQVYDASGMAFGFPEPPVYQWVEGGVATRMRIRNAHDRFIAQPEAERLRAALHEIGHGLCLAHDERSAWRPTVMGVLRTLAPWDIYTIGLAYPTIAIEGARLMAEPTAKMVRLPWPEDSVITQEFGVNGHRGVDVWNAQGEGTLLVNPFESATIHEHVPGDGYGGGTFGNHVVLDPGDGWPLVVAHLSRFWLDSHGNGQNGNTLHAGAPIGYMGYTGYVQPPGVAGLHAHVQRDCRGGLTANIADCRNPLDYMTEEPMTANERKIVRAAYSDDNTEAYYRALVNAGILVSEVEPSDTSINGFLVRRFRINGILGDAAKTDAAAAILNV